MFLVINLAIYNYFLPCFVSASLENRKARNAFRGTVGYEYGDMSVEPVPANKRQLQLPLMAIMAISLSLPQTNEET